MNSTQTSSRAFVQQRGKRAAYFGFAAGILIFGALAQAADERLVPKGIGSDRDTVRPLVDPTRIADALTPEVEPTDIAQPRSTSFNGHGEYQVDAAGFYYAMTGGKFPTGNTPNGDNASGGTFRYLTDEPAWGSYTLGVWYKDDWFPTNAGIALTLKDGAAIVYDNNGLEDNSYGDYYDAEAQGLPSASTPGLYRGYAMSNNFDWIYAGYFKITAPTQITEIIGYFDENAGFNRNAPFIRYRMNIWSNVTGDLLPTNTGSFVGDVFTSDGEGGTFTTSDTGVDRVFGADYAFIHDDIFRLNYVLSTPIVLPPGEYWFSHDASFVAPSTVYVDDDYCDGCANDGHFWNYDAFDNIQDGLDAVSGSTVNVGPGTYAGNLVVPGGVTLQSTGGAAVTTIAGSGGCAVTVGGDDVEVIGFTVTNPNGNYAICTTDHSRVSILDNIVTDVGHPAISGNVHAIVAECSAAAIDDILIEGNAVSDVRVGPTKSASGITVGFSTGSEWATNVVIRDNSVTDVLANTNEFGSGGRGAYGIQINHGTGTTGRTDAPLIVGNSISNLEGLWAHGIGLEGYTPNAVVECNTINNLIDHKTPSDAVGIQVEDNAGASTVTLNHNSFTNVDIGVQNVTGTPVNAENNWWGDASGPSGTGPGSGAAATANVDFDPWLDGGLNALILSADDCQDDANAASGYQIVVELRMAGLCQPVTGFEAFITYDNGALTYRGDLSSYTAGPFTSHFTGINQANDGELALDGSVYPSTTGTSADALLATLVFDVPSGCENETVSFRVGGPFASDLSFQGVPVPTNLVDTAPFTADDTAPTITTCPAAAVFECDGAGNVADIAAWLATFAASDVDSCSGVTLTNDYAALSDDCAATGGATVTFTATDDCGNVTTCQSTVTVEDTMDPVLACPADITIECDTPTLPEVTGVPGWFQGFEDNRDGWLDYDGTLTRAPDGTDGVPSAAGSWHAVTDGAFTRWGGYASTFPAGGYSTSVDVYLDTTAGLTSGVQFDYSSAINDPSGNHRRDFVLTIGFYDSADVSGPGAGTDRFVMSASNNSPGWPKNPARSPYAVSATGWYTIVHRFYDSGGGVLAVDVELYDSGATLLHSWTLSDPADIIGSTVGGNRYGWFLNMGWSLPIDNTRLSGIQKATDACDGSPDVSYADVFAPGACVGSGTITRTWTAVDDCGNDTSCIQLITLEDTTAPAITCPADVVVECDASLLPEDIDATAKLTFDANPAVGNDQAPGVWYRDRYAPAGFVSESYLGDNRLKHSLAAADGTSNRPPAFSSTFYDTQGRKYDLAAGTVRMSIDLYLPADWATTGRRMAGLWGTLFDASNDVSGYPILEFTSTDSNPRFRWYSQDIDQDDSNGYQAGWIDLPVSIAYDTWHTLTIELLGGSIRGTVDGYEIVDIMTFDSVRIANVILQGYNNAAGVTYDIYWDDFMAAKAPVTADNCDPAPSLSYDDDVSGLGCNGTGIRVRTWTAEDACGNDSTCTQQITVQDNAPPVISDCPANITVNADAGGCDAVVSWTEPTAADNCGLQSFVSTHNPGDTFPTGTTTVTYTATDACGAESTCSFDVTVNAVNDVDVEVELAGVTDPTTRCIHFRTDLCGNVANVELSFIDHDANASTPVRFVGTIQVPCGAWTKLCAKDQQHTLWDTTVLTDAGTYYDANTLLSLRGGDTDNDADVDIHDVTWFIMQFGQAAAYGNCPWDGTRDADFSNNTGVGSEDYTFLTDNWLTYNACACTAMRPNVKPIKTPQLAMTRDSAAIPLAVFDRVDLNHDNVIDVNDVASFERLNGLSGQLSRKMRQVTTPRDAGSAELGESLHLDGR